MKPRCITRTPPSRAWTLVLAGLATFMTALDTLVVTTALPVLRAGLRTAVTELAAARADQAIPMPWELWRTNFIQAAGEQLARASFGRLVPDPYRPVFEPIRLRRQVHRELSASFVAMSDDQTMPAGFWHPGMTGRLPGAHVVEIDGDHEVMLSAPTRLADALHHAATAASGRAA